MTRISKYYLLDKAWGFQFDASRKIAVVPLLLQEILMLVDDEERQQLLYTRLHTSIAYQKSSEALPIYGGSESNLYGHLSHLLAYQKWSKMRLLLCWTCSLAYSRHNMFQDNIVI